MDIGDVGDGTAYPMLVTTGELAEIFYRVRDAWFTSGTIEISPGYTYSVSGTPSLVQLANGETYSSDELGSYVNYVRGYCASDTLDPSVFYYEFDVPGGLNPDLFDVEYSTSYGNFRDILPKELNLWQLLIDSDTHWSGCAFNHYFMSEAGVTEEYESETVPHYGLFNYITDGTFGEISVVVHNEVAWVGGSGPFDPDSQLYLKITAGVNTLDSTFNTDGSGGAIYELPIRLVFQLQSGSPSCPFYDNMGTATGTNFILEAQEWWPYGDANGNPVWNTSTGIKL